MGSLYRDKKSSGCAACKPHKHGWAKKFKGRELAERQAREKEAQSATNVSHGRDCESAYGSSFIRKRV